MKTSVFGTLSKLLDTHWHTKCKCSGHTCLEIHFPCHARMSAFKIETVTCSAARQSVNGVSATCFGKGEVGLLQLQRLGQRLGQLCVRVHALQQGICSRVHALQQGICSSSFGKSLLQQRLGQREDQQCSVGSAWTRSERRLH